MQLARWIIAAAHVLAGGAWFGAMLYSLMVLHPRARSFFSSSRQFEEFIAHVAAGALDGLERGGIHSSYGHRLAALARRRTYVHWTECLRYRQDSLLRDCCRSVLFYVLEIMARADIGFR